MRCDKVNLLILSHLDGTLSEYDEAILMEHVADCGACACELAARKRLSEALRAIGQEEAQAPPELCGLVMGSLQSQRRKSIIWLPASWRSAIAAAAAAILLIAGVSAGFTGGLKIADIGKMIGFTTPGQPVNTETAGGVSVTDKAPGERTSPPGIITENLNVNGVPEGQQGDPADGTEDGSGTGAPDSDNNNAGKTAAEPSVNVPLALLKSEMKINSTVLTVAVNDLTGARAKAVALAAGADASTQVFPEQGDGKKVVVVRLAAGRDDAPGLVAGLSGVGSLVDRRDESRDITSIYNETMVQYYDLQSRIGTAGEADKHQMEVQAESYRQQLDSWQNEAGKWVITLWLEGK